jgi:hypothetical protein
MSSILASYALTRPDILRNPTTTRVTDSTGSRIVHLVDVEQLGEFATDDSCSPRRAEATSLQTIMACAHQGMKDGVSVTRES